MKAVAWILISPSLLMIADVIKEQYSGHATITSRGHAQEALKAVDPEEFDYLIFSQWVQSLPLGLAGLIILAWIRRHERLDPTSPKFRGVQALEDFSDYLDEKRRGP